MHYLPGLLNNENLFLRLNSIFNDEITDEYSKNKINRFLYRATCVLNSLAAIKQAEEISVMFVREYLNQIKLPDNKRIAVSTEPLLQSYMHIPAALYSIVNMQNLLPHIFSGILDINPLKRENNLSKVFSKSDGTLKKKY